MRQSRVRANPSGPEQRCRSLTTRPDILLQPLRPARQDRNTVAAGVSPYIVQRAAERRMFERTLVHDARSRSCRDRGMAMRVQRRETEEVTGRADARPVRETVGPDGRYNAERLQSPPLLKSGGRRFRRTDRERADQADYLVCHAFARLLRGRAGRGLCRVHSDTDHAAPRICRSEVRPMSQPSTWRVPSADTVVR